MNSTMSAWVWIIDDSPTDLDLASIAIAECCPEISVDTFDGGPPAVAALKRAAAEGGLPALILLDVKMPMLNGFDVLAVIRQQLRLSVPVVMLSTSTSQSDRVKSLALGATDYAVKPADYEHFREVVEQLVHKYCR